MDDMPKVPRFKGSQQKLSGVGAMIYTIIIYHFSTYCLFVDLELNLPIFRYNKEIAFFTPLGDLWVR